MKVKSIDLLKVRLPFRFAFGHSLATRSYSDNLIVKVKLEDGTIGYGEGIPRSYVTGESLDQSFDTVRLNFIPAFLGLEVSSPSRVLEQLKEEFCRQGLEASPRGAAWCALELAILDAVARFHHKSVGQLLGPLKTNGVTYGAVLPFSKKQALLPLLWFYRLYGFKTVKIKVGRHLEDDLKLVKLCRKILGRQMILRVDANCAWTTSQAIEAAKRLEEYEIASIEQPVAVEDFSGLAKVTTAVKQQVIVDESLCTLKQARKLIEHGACHGFNIRISKVGGILSALQITDLGQQAGLSCHLGAQVGESGILTSAGRIVACLKNSFENHEGADNLFLLKKDLTNEDLTVKPGGQGYLSSGDGLGVTINRHLNQFVLGQVDHGDIMTVRR